MWQLSNESRLVGRAPPSDSLQQVRAVPGSGVGAAMDCFSAGLSQRVGLGDIPKCWPTAANPNRPCVFGSRGVAGPRSRPSSAELKPRRTATSSAERVHTSPHERSATPTRKQTRGAKAEVIPRGKEAEAIHLPTESRPSVSVACLVAIATPSLAAARRHDCQA